MRAARGFSLVEIMTVIALMSIMMAITFISFSGKRDETALKVSAREVASAIRLAQSDALSGVREDGNTNGLCFHGIAGTSDNTYELSVTHLKSGSGQLCSDPDERESFSLGSYVLDGGVTFGSPSWGVSFSVPRGDIMEASDQNIVLQKNGEYSSVCVLASGVVIEKPVSSAVPSCP